MGEKNQDDFLYGWYLAKADDFCTNQYFTRYHITPSQEDRDEIQGILFCRGGWINSFRSLGQNGDEFTLIHRNIILNFVFN